MIDMFKNKGILSFIIIVIGLAYMVSIQNQKFEQLEDKNQTIIIDK